MSTKKHTNPAYISHAHLKGYKSIIDTEVELHPGLNVIIGPNGSGKTHFLEFLYKVTNIEFDKLPKEIKLILAKDLDGLPSETKKINAITQKSNKLKKKVEIAYLFFLIIFELEALILADFDTFKKIFDIKQTFKKSPIHQKNPKELLKQYTAKAKKQYKESEALAIFQQLNFQEVYQNHNEDLSFQSFIDELETTLN